VRIEQREALTDLVTGDLGDAALLRTAFASSSNSAQVVRCSTTL